MTVFVVFAALWLWLWWKEHRHAVRCEREWYRAEVRTAFALWLSLKHSRINSEDPTASPRFRFESERIARQGMHHLERAATHHREWAERLGLNHDAEVAELLADLSAQR